MKIGIVAIEFFDAAVGPMGGYGMLAREAGLLLRRSGHVPVFLSGELSPGPSPRRTESAGIPLLFAHEDWPQYVESVREHQLDALLTIDYRPNYDYPLYAAPAAPVILWVQDPRPPADIDKINTLRVPGSPGAPQGISAIDCTALRDVVQDADSRGRPIAFASPAPTLTAAKAPATFRVAPRDSVVLPYMVDLSPATTAKAERPRVIFLGRLDPDQAAVGLRRDRPPPSRRRVSGIVDKLTFTARGRGRRAIFHRISRCSAT